MGEFLDLGSRTRRKSEFLTFLASILASNHIKWLQSGGSGCTLKLTPSRGDPFSRESGKGLSWAPDFAGAAALGLFMYFGLVFASSAQFDTPWYCLPWAEKTFPSCGRVMTRRDGYRTGAMGKKIRRSVLTFGLSILQIECNNQRGRKDGSLESCIQEG